MRHRGGSKLREYATQPELDFLNYVLDGALKTDAARRAGLPKSINLTILLRRPLIAKVFAELQEKRKDQSVEAAERRREERSQFLHAELMHRLRTAVTHERTGDLGIAKMLEVGFKSTGEVAANSITATASATAQTNVTAEIDIYKPLWLREAEAQMLAESKKRILGAPAEVGEGRKLTPAKAKEYVFAAKGDNRDDSARSEPQTLLGVLGDAARYRCRCASLSCS